MRFPLHLGCRFQWIWLSWSLAFPNATKKQNCEGPRSFAQLSLQTAQRLSAKFSNALNVSRFFIWKCHRSKCGGSNPIRPRHPDRSPCQCLTLQEIYQTPAPDVLIYTLNHALTSFKHNQAYPPGCSHVGASNTSHQATESQHKALRHHCAFHVQSVTPTNLMTSIQALESHENLRAAAKLLENLTESNGRAPVIVKVPGPLCSEPESQTAMHPKDWALGSIPPTVLGPSQMPKRTCKRSESYDWYEIT